MKWTFVSGLVCTTVVVVVVPWKYCDSVYTRRRIFLIFLATRSVLLDGTNGTRVELMKVHLSVNDKLIIFISPPRKSFFLNLTIDLLSLGIYARGPQVLTYRPQILRGVRI